MRTIAPRGLSLLPPVPEVGQDPILAAAGFPALSLKRKMPFGLGCHYCHARATTRDHVVAKTRRGMNSYWNLVPACARCNGRKASSGSGCACAFCERARWLFDLGHRRR